MFVSGSTSHTAEQNDIINPREYEGSRRFRIQFKCIHYFAEQGTLEECIAEISHQFLLGSMRGSYVRGVHALVANIYEDAAKLQFREPTALRETGHLETRPRDNVLEDSQKGGGGGLGDPLGSPVGEKEGGQCII